MDNTLFSNEHLEEMLKDAELKLLETSSAEEGRMALQIIALINNLRLEKTLREKDLENRTLYRQSNMRVSESGCSDS